MNFLILGIVLFFAMHLVPAVPSLRGRLISVLGELGYKAAYSLVSLAGLVLMVYGFSQAPIELVYVPPAWGRDVVFVIMALSFVLLTAGDMKSNLKRFTRHPMLWGVVLWSGVHLTVNGNLAEVLLFGAFLIYSLVAMFSANIRGATLQQAKHPVKKDIIMLVGGIVVYAIFAKWLHPWLIGVAVI